MVTTDCGQESGRQFDDNLFTTCDNRPSGLTIFLSDTVARDLLEKNLPYSFIHIQKSIPSMLLTCKQPNGDGVSAVVNRDCGQESRRWFNDNFFPTCDNRPSSWTIFLSDIVATDLLFSSKFHRYSK